MDHDKHFRLLIQHMSDGVVIIGTDGLIRFTNPAAEQLFQQTSQELHESPFAFPILKSGTTEIEIVAKSGRSTSVEMRVVPIEWENKPAYLASLRDVTERRKADEERRRHETERQYAQKLESLGVLAGGIAHDFNNLLMTIVARSGLALRSLPQDAPATDHLKFIEKAGLRGGELANQMLTFAGQTKLNFQSLQLSKLLKDMEPFLRATISKRISLQYDLDTSLPLVHADQPQLRQIIMNVVLNAADAIGEQEGVITLTTSLGERTKHDFDNSYLIGDLPKGQCISLTIGDTGCGMKLDMIPKIFDPFFSTKFPGRGLGLAVLLGIARAHSAAIAVQSQPEIGTTFELLFPATQPHPSTKKVSPVTIPTELSLPPKKPLVLIVDDEEDVRVTCSLILQEIGIDALVASDGEVGLQVFQQHQESITTVLLDLTMPKMDGHQLYEKIREINSTVPVILSSGYSEKEAMKQFQGSGINAFIQKPYQVEVLINKIQSFTQKSSTPPKLVPKDTVE
ncbi:MAG: response regulator [Nitrospirales bacterium]|jgi:signal transduction histidine kinase/ActR/RegA family two-component response regulator